MFHTLKSLIQSINRSIWQVGAYYHRHINILLYVYAYYGSLDPIGLYSTYTLPSLFHFHRGMDEVKTLTTCPSHCIESMLSR